MFLAVRKAATVRAFFSHLREMQAHSRVLWSVAYLQYVQCLGFDKNRFSSRLQQMREEWQPWKMLESR